MRDTGLVELSLAVGDGGVEQRQRVAQAPSDARTSRGSADGSKGTPSLSRMALRLAVSDSGEIGLKSKRWHRDSTVAGIFFGSVVARMKTTWAGGSSSVFRNALNAGPESMWTSSTMYTLKRPRAGEYFTFSRSVRMSSTPVFEAASISITSTGAPDDEVRARGTGGARLGADARGAA